ncbi:MAG: hypothetical protein JJU01_09055 [Alkalibacterium sp.]|nr:hypothetical protein [Alkalibacterium sp.]
MNFYFSFIIQLFIFFLIVTSIAGLFTKNQKKPPHSKSGQGGDSVEIYPPQNIENEEVKRNAQKKSEQTNRPTRTQREKRERYQRYDRNKKSDSPLKGVVNLSSSVQKKKNRTPAVTFNKSKLKEAIIYKEILDKPLSMRDSDER